jgi:phosphatidylinositol dimannoside acyltransferase
VSDAPRARGLEAPHRRREQGPRILEKGAVAGYATATWIVGHVPVALARWVIGTGSQAGYLGWPTKRRWSNANFGHVLGLPPDDPRVRRLALRAYREYATYLVETMRLENLTGEAAAERVVQADLDHIQTTWDASNGGLIFAVGHVGNNEAIAAAAAHRGWPVNVVADDSSFPEMFERFRQLREAWGVHVIPWRNLREIYKVLRNREMLALLVDWGYRSDGIPVRLFGAWTTLPAGPATLAAKTSSSILPLSIRRMPDHRFHVSYGDVITVHSSSPADLQRATQAIADSLQATVGAAPDQWYSFKPMWPPTDEEAAELEARAAAMLADDGSRSGPGSVAAPRGAADAPLGEGSATDGPAAHGSAADPVADPHLRAAEA